MGKKNKIYYEDDNLPEIQQLPVIGSIWHEENKPYRGIEVLGALQWGRKKTWYIILGGLDTITFFDNRGVWNVTLNEWKDMVRGVKRFEDRKLVRLPESEKI